MSVPLGRILASLDWFSSLLALLVARRRRRRLTFPVPEAPTNINGRPEYLPSLNNPK